VAKPDRISDLERRQKCLEAEIVSALSCFTDDDPMIGDLKTRLLHLRHELVRQRHMVAGRQNLH